MGGLWLFNRMDLIGGDLGEHLGFAVGPDNGEIDCCFVLHAEMLFLGMARQITHRAVDFAPDRLE